MASSTPTLSRCCVTGFKWDGAPTGTISTLAANPTYVAGDPSSPAAVLLVHDALGWTFPNLRLLADHIATEASCTVYLPDFFGGEVLAPEPLCAGRWHELDMPGFMSRNSRAIREPEIFACARALRSEKGHTKIGALGYCFGGWAVFRLGSSIHNPPLVDCISTGHPSLLTKQDIDEVKVPVQMLAPEVDSMFTEELKLHAFQTLMRNGVPFDYQHFPVVQHACMSRGDPNVKGEREAMVRGKNAAVDWFRQWLH